ncbi:dCTP deaminase [Pseudomonas shirazensis]
MAGNLIRKVLRLDSNGILYKKDIENLIIKKRLFIEPLLDKSQIGEISVDLRIGTDFLALHQGRQAYIDTTQDLINRRPIKSHFTETRRKIGESFLLHPSQPILFSTLEYIKLPEDVYAILTLRSSYSRLGLTISTIVQPGYCGCVSIEVVNSGNTPIKILAGARFIQARFIKLKEKSEYFRTQRKYTCQVRPVTSKANEDVELEILKQINSTL